MITAASRIKESAFRIETWFSAFPPGCWCELSVVVAQIVRPWVWLAGMSSLVVDQSPKTCSASA